MPRTPLKKNLTHYNIEPDLILHGVLMKKIILMLASLLSLFAFTALAYADKYDDLEKYGFRLIKEDNEKLHLSLLHYPKKNYIILSKQRFKNAWEAQQFCNDLNVSFADGLWISLGFAMSGVCENHPFIRSAIVFDFSDSTTPPFPDSKEQSGIWAWSNNADGIIDYMLDGHSFNDGKVTVTDLNSAINSEVTLPAICSNLKAPFNH
jgi:hypothetical protein